MSSRYMFLGTAKSRAKNMISVFGSKHIVKNVFKWGVITVVSRANQITHPTHKQQREACMHETEPFVHVIQS